MAKRKLTNDRLLQLLDEGLTYEAIAERHGISKQAVGKRARRLRGVVTKAAVSKGMQTAIDRRIDILAELKELNTKAQELLAQAEQRDDIDVVLKLLAEIRQQLNLAGNLMALIADVNAVAQFQETVLRVIGEQDETTQRQIVEALNAERSLRQSVHFGIETARYTDSE
jgi:predicted DNA-binding protein YlxM (UPF0122 family)